MEEEEEQTECVVLGDEEEQTVQVVEEEQMKGLSNQAPQESLHSGSSDKNCGNNGNIRSTIY